MVLIYDNTTSKEQQTAIPTNYICSMFTILGHVTRIYRYDSGSFTAQFGLFVQIRHLRCRTIERQIRCASCHFAEHIYIRQIHLTLRSDKILSDGVYAMRTIKCYENTRARMNVPLQFFPVSWGKVSKQRPHDVVSL